MKTEKQEIQAIERVIGYILRIGVLVSAAIILFGLLLLLLHGSTEYSATHAPTDFQTIFLGLGALKAGAYIQLGIFCLILTPVLRVVVSIYAFLQEKDYLYVGITTIVLIILAIGILIGFFEK
ncbi:DUF1634 domain-containing protein [Enterococcus sp. CSURQ0835]|uniref:DUF1634 domain-containing protein n=1 Tax=Enterococcus sp. CSURQ0835 TaxID=2681394 RepID=UPI0013593FC7|nr:DUF1634 domain-containing protein [Enterococcus sp. CSURQ0835]